MSHSTASLTAPAWRDLYLEQGYVVVRGLMNPALIDTLLQRYQAEIVPSRHKFLRQSTSRFERNRFTGAGHVEQSFLDIHGYRRQARFREAALALFLAPEMIDALSRVNGHAEHSLMQTMFFDANTATQAHQDYWYLDSAPGGQLIAAWMALEDIHEDAGRFFVLPGSHRVSLYEPGMSHEQWIERVRLHVREHEARVSAPALRAGDVLFWNSRTIHGALPTRDPRRSRKSLTAHYLPAGLGFGNLFRTRSDIVYEHHGAHRVFVNQPEHSLRAEAEARLRAFLSERPRLLAALRVVRPPRP